MTLPTSEPLPPAEENAPSAVSAPRRRSRRVEIPAGSAEQSAFLTDLAHRFSPSFDFFLFTMLAGLALAIAIIVDAQAFFVLAALLSPFMAPVAGIAFATILGSPRFVAQSTGALVVGSLMIFIWGVLTGWLARFWPGLSFEQAALHTRFSWPDMIVLILGAGLTALTLVRSPRQRPLVTSVAVAYELYLPAGVAGFGLASGLPGLWPDGLLVFAFHLGLACLTGAVVLVALGLRPLNRFGYALGASLGAAALAALILVNSMGMMTPPQLPGLAAAPSPDPLRTVRPVVTVLTPSQTPMPATATRTPTNTLVPSRTPTLTVTPIPTPVWAYIKAKEGGGAYIRKEPSYQGALVKSILNGMLVEVLPETREAEGVTWARVQTVDGELGWIMRSLLVTATPAPGW